MRLEKARDASIQFLWCLPMLVLIKLFSQFRSIFDKLFLFAFDISVLLLNRVNIFTNIHSNSMEDCSKWMMFCWVILIKFLWDDAINYEHSMGPVIRNYFYVGIFKVCELEEKQLFSSFQRFFKKKKERKNKNNLHNTHVPIQLVPYGQPTRCFFFTYFWNFSAHQRFVCRTVFISEAKYGEIQFENCIKTVIR